MLINKQINKQNNAINKTKKFIWPIILGHCDRHKTAYSIDIQ